MDFTEEQIRTLRGFSTPTLSNAIELFDRRPRNQGFMSPEIRCLFPELGTMVGHAVTARFTADQPAVRPGSRYELWQHILTVPAPRILVLQDLDHPVGAGAFVGEVMATIHQRLGCVGVVTNGHVRDLDEVHALGFHFFAAGVCVSHSYVDLVDFGNPVKVGGLMVNTGDLLHGDKHGMLSIPKEIVPELPGAVAKIVEREQRILACCKSPQFDLEELRQQFES
jgi:regulator of RNase E activity RraA